MISFIISNLQALSDYIQVSAIGQRQAESCQGRVWTAGARQHNTELGLRLSVVEKARMPHWYIRDAPLRPCGYFCHLSLVMDSYPSPTNMCWIVLMWQLDTLIWQDWPSSIVNSSGLFEYTGCPLACACSAGKIDRLKNQLEFNLIKGRHGGGK
jgi:hypothetical protein